MSELVNWWNQAVLPPTVLPLALVCAICGGFVLSFFNRGMGRATLVFNVAALFVSAYLANLLTNNMWIPLDRFYERPIVVSCLGMAVAAILLLSGQLRGTRV